MRREAGVSAGVRRPLVGGPSSGQLSHLCHAFFENRPSADIRVKTPVGASRISSDFRDRNIRRFRQPPARESIFPAKDPANGL